MRLSMKFFKIISLTLVGLFVSGLLILFFLPKPALLEGIPFSYAVFDKNNELLRLTISQDEKYRVFTPLQSFSPSLIEATLLQEDQYFWQHVGINPLAMAKAFWQTYVLHTRRFGASTITMQVARLRFDIQSKHWAGKLKQIIRALQLEMHYSKEEILEAYLNLAPYGGNIEGVGAASLIYFNKKVKNISLPEALTLSVIPQNPTKRVPDKMGMTSVRNKLFDRWVKLHQEDKNQTYLFKLPVQMRSPRHLPFEAPHFTNAILMDKNKPSLNAVTTLDLNLQHALEHVLQSYTRRTKNKGVSNAALMLVDRRDMEIKALIGSTNFFDPRIQGQINGTAIKRSPGSTLKPFIYALALDEGVIHPYTVLKDVSSSFSGYNPENFDYDFLGPVRAKDALILSRNIPALYLTNQLKKNTLYQLLEKAQVSELKPENYYGLALALGGAELTMRELIGLYLALVNEGQWKPIRKFVNEPLGSGVRLFSREASFLVLDMLKDTVRPDNLVFSNANFPIAWKTGTSSGFRDAWTVGAFGPYVLAVWLGNFNNQSNQALVGKDIAAPLFFEVIAAVKENTKGMPPLSLSSRGLNLTKVAVCKASGLLPTRYCPELEMTWFIPGRSPIKIDNIYREVAIDSRSGLQTCHPDKDTRFEVYEFWSTDLLKIFKQAGIQRRIPPPFMKGCIVLNPRGFAPQITSLQEGVRYIINARTQKTMEIPLSATTDADVRMVYWFINDTFLGKTAPSTPFMWNAKSGKYVVRVLDDHGLSSARDITIQLEG